MCLIVSLRICLAEIFLLGEDKAITILYVSNSLNKNSHLLFVGRVCSHPVKRATTTNMVSKNHPHIVLSVDR